MDITKWSHNRNKSVQKILLETVWRDDRSKQNDGIVSVPRVMNTINLAGKSISLINILKTEYKNLVKSLRKSFLPGNMVTREPYRKSYRKKIDFSFNSAHCAFFMKMGTKLRGKGGLHNAYPYLGQGLFLIFNFTKKNYTFYRWIFSQKYFSKYFV